MELPEEIWVLMSRCLSGEASAEEQQRFQAALSSYPQLMQQFDMMTRLWNNHALTEHANNEESKVNRILQRSAVQDSLDKETGNLAENLSYKRPVIKTFFFRYAAVAAILILVVSVSVMVWKKGHTHVAASSSTNNQIIAENGSRTRTILPDGSTVVLNAGSKILYSKNFTGKLREVTLYGEAFFDVAKNPERPFIVHAGGINIRVLGTAFNVKSYPDDQVFETTLIHGLVQITNNNDKKQAPIYLHPNQKFIAAYFDRSDNDEDENEHAEDLDKSSFTIKTLDSTVKEMERIETAWVYNRLEFRGDSFAELAKKLERWYNISIRFEDEGVKQLQFTGSLEKETVEQAFTALQAAVPFNFTIKNHEVFIKASK